MPASSDEGLECHLKKRKKGESPSTSPLHGNSPFKMTPYSIKVGRKIAQEACSPLAKHSNHNIFPNGGLVAGLNHVALMSYRAISLLQVLKT